MLTTNNLNNLPETIHILLVDDDFNTCKILKLLFKKYGYDIDTAHTGGEALKLINQFNYNLALLDIKLPDMDGIELIPYLKDIHPLTIIMMVTAYASQETAIQALNMGASAYLLKPFNMQEVIHKVQEIIKLQETEIEKENLRIRLERELEERKKVEEQIKLSEEKYRVLFNNAFDPIFLIELHDNFPIRVLEANDIACRKMEYTREELLKMGPKDFSEPVIFEKNIGKVIQDFQNKGHTMIEMIHITKNGLHFPVEINSQCFQFKEKTVTLSIARDITERKQAEADLAEARDSLALKVEERTKELKNRTIELQKLMEDLSRGKTQIELIINSLPEGLAVIDSEGKFYLFNDVFKDYYHDFSLKEEIPLQIKDIRLFENDFTDTLMKLFTSQKEQSLNIEPKEGIHLKLTSVPIKMEPESFLGMIITVIDITPFVELDHLQKQFVSIVSHELRTPITAIDLSISNLQKFQEKMTAEQSHDLIKTIAESSQVLNQMIEDLLILSRIEMGKLSLSNEKFSLNDLIKEILHQMIPIISEKNLDFETEIQPDNILYADRNRIGQVLRIIIDNACKYSFKDGKIQLKVFEHYKGIYNQSNVKGILIQISDQGIGINLHEQKRLFQRFFRGSNVQQIQGTGLGLSIAKEFITLHNGNIFVESEINKGTIVSIFLPQTD